MSEISVSPWNMIAGRLTHVKVNTKIFCLCSDRPEELEPIETILNFFKVVDLQKTELLLKTKVPETKTELKPLNATNKRRRININEYEDPLTRINNLAVYESKVRAIYRKFGSLDMFYNSDIFDYLKECYPNVSDATIQNKTNVYTKYLEKEGYIKIIERIRSKKVFRFVAAPFDGILPMQAEETDSEFIQKMKIGELEGIRPQNYV